MNGARDPPHSYQHRNRRTSAASSSGVAASSAAASAAASGGSDPHVTCYRFGSVGEDTHLCLWDMTEDMLKKSYAASSDAKATSTATGKSSQAT